MTINLYKLFQAENRDANALLESHKISGRDNGRTPFQWDSSENAGFTTGTPRLKVNPNFTEINHAAQETNENSPLNYFRRLIKFRKANPILVYGKYTLVDSKNPDVYAYTTELNQRKLLILLNFKSDAAVVDFDADLSRANVLVSNYPAASSGGKLKPYDAVILELEA